MKALIKTNPQSTIIVTKKSTAKSILANINRKQVKKEVSKFGTNREKFFSVSFNLSQHFHSYK